MMIMTNVMQLSKSMQVLDELESCTSVSQIQPLFLSIAPYLLPFCFVVPVLHVMMGPPYKFLH